MAAASAGEGGGREVCTWLPLKRNCMSVPLCFPIWTKVFTFQWSEADPMSMLSLSLSQVKSSLLYLASGSAGEEGEGEGLRVGCDCHGRELVYQSSCLFVRVCVSLSEGTKCLSDPVSVLCLSLPVPKLKFSHIIDGRLPLRKASCYVIPWWRDGPFGTREVCVILGRISMDLCTTLCVLLCVYVFVCLSVCL